MSCLHSNGQRNVSQVQYWLQLSKDLLEHDWWLLLICAVKRATGIRDWTWQSGYHRQSVAALMTKVEITDEFQLKPVVVNPSVAGCPRDLIDMNFQSTSAASHTTHRHMFVQYSAGKPWVLILLQMYLYRSLALLNTNQRSSITLYSTGTGDTFSQEQLIPIIKQNKKDVKLQSNWALGTKTRSKSTTQRH